MDIDFTPKFVMIWKVCIKTPGEHILQTPRNDDFFFKTRKDAEEFMSKTQHGDCRFCYVSEILAVQQDIVGKTTRYFPFDTAVVFKDNN